MESRAAPQGGYNVVFQPLKDGKACGQFRRFRRRLRRRGHEPGRAAFRPTGLAVRAGRRALHLGRYARPHLAADLSWRPNAPIAAAPGTPSTISEADNPAPPEGIHPDAGRSDADSLPLPPGVTETSSRLGDRIFHGEAENGTCSGCHGSDARGTPEGPT